jgi:hypothetical protein
MMMTFFSRTHIRDKMKSTAALLAAAVVAAHGPVVATAEGTVANVVLVGATGNLVRHRAGQAPDAGVCRTNPKNTRARTFKLPDVLDRLFFENRSFISPPEGGGRIDWTVWFAC